MCYYLPVSEFSDAWLLHEKDFLGTEEMREYGKAVLLRLRFEFDEVKGERDLVGGGGVNNDLGLALVANEVVEGIILKA